MTFAKAAAMAACLSLATSLPAAAQISSFQHVVIVVQENRTPDNLFQGLCTQPTSCSTNPTSTQYDIQTKDWLDKESNSGVTQPTAVRLANGYDLGHTHKNFNTMCDLNPTTGACMMDGAADELCTGKCPPNPQFRYVDNANGIVDPYLALATQYGWANYMFETNQGPSYPAHQFLFGATSAPSAKADHQGTFASENGVIGFEIGGCAAAPGATVPLIDANGIEHKANKIFPCFEHKTIADLLDQTGFSWRYYAPDAGNIWTAPNSIGHICEAKNQQCTGQLWTQNVDLAPSDVLKDVSNCQLRNVSWVIPTGQNSDHPKDNRGGGPAWVASVVNAIGNSACKDGSTSYWDDTAIIITWDDWGGWYDHVAPAFLPYPEGGYQYGFRVPLVFVSAYTPQGFIENNNRLDFGSIARFVEHNFSMREGMLTFADARTKTDLTRFYNLGNAPRPFKTIPSPHDARYFLEDKSPPLPPDDD